MHIMIDIQEEIYQKIKGAMLICGRRNNERFDSILFDAVSAGIPLPKGHGKLGDLDALREEVSSWGMNDYEPSDFIDVIDQADTIVEADTESEGEEEK